MTLAPIELIEAEDRIRSLSEAKVRQLAASIAEVGLINPITVRTGQVSHRGSHIRIVDGYRVIAGAHRLEACKRLGMTEVPVHVVTLSHLERQIAECDENLCSTELTKAERALFTSRRKLAYEALHPETRAGAIRANAANVAMGRNVDENFSSTTAFTADTAARTGVTQRLVQLDAERGDKIASNVLSNIVGTRLDSGTYLDQLKSVPIEKQAKKVRNDLKAAKPKKTKRQIVAEQCKAIISAWGRASTEARKMAMEELGLEKQQQQRAVLRIVGSNGSAA